MNVEAEIKKLWEKLNCLVDFFEENGTCTITQTVPGHSIAIHTNEIGVVTEIKETITTFTEVSEGVYAYVNENGESVEIVLSAAKPPVFSSLDEAFSNLGANKAFIYSDDNLDGAVAFTQAWT